MFRVGLYTLCFLLFQLHSIAQYYSSGQNPSSIKWRQINSEHFNLIYPESFESRASKLVQTLEDSYIKTTTSLEQYPQKTPIIVNSYNSESNGVTYWAPNRIDFYTCPPFDNYAQEWLTQLSIHEFRHIIQLDKTNQGFTKFLTYLLGEQANAAIVGLFVPPWFLEGDAVCTETAFSNVGRGRIPAFEMPLRAQVLQTGIYSYDKAVLGSYKTRVPNHYELGYHLVSFTRQKYGIASWNAALNTVARKPFFLNPFNRGLRKTTQKTKEELYKQTLDELTLKWKKQDSVISKNEYTILNKPAAKYEKLMHATYISDTVLVAMHSSPDFLTHFTKIAFGKKGQNICTPGYLNSNAFTQAKKQSTNIENNTSKSSKNEEFVLCWSELTADLRWQMRNYSDIMLYDTETQKTIRLTNKMRYFSPAISPDASMICAVKITPELENSIVLIDAVSGNEIKTLLLSKLDNFQTPQWEANSESIVYIRNSTDGKSIEIIDTRTLKIEQLLPPTFTEISYPSFVTDYVFFNGSHSGIENVHAIDLKTKKVFQVTHSSFGARDGAINPGKTRLAYSDYDVSGYRIVETNFEPEKWASINPDIPFNYTLADFITQEEKSLSKAAKADTLKIYKSKAYKKGLHLFNFHSWMPAYFNYSAEEYFPGVTLLSQNLLSTATTLLGYKYDLAEQTGKTVVEFNWEGWYPIFSLSASRGKRTAYTHGDTSVKYNFDETNVNLGLSIPFTFTAGKYNKYILLNVSNTLYSTSNFTSKETNSLIGTIHSLNYQIIAYRLLKQAQKDLQPKWGNILILTYKHTPFGNNNLGEVLGIETRNYFPSLWRNHGIRIDLRIQSKKPGVYAYSNAIAMPRGYLIRNFSEFGVAAINYKFPVAYPEWSLGKFIYLKRIKNNFFLDAGIGNQKSVSFNLLSLGLELNFDLHFLRFQFPFDLGYRVGVRPLDKTLFGDFLFSLNLPN